MLMKRRTFVAGVSATTIAAVLAACSDGTKKAAEKEEVKVADYLKADYSELKQGGTLTLGTYELAPQQNPHHGDSTLEVVKLWRLYNPVLIHYTPEGEWSPNADYLTDVKDEVKDGKTVVTYTINDKATFNDGTPIDYTAFVATWMANRGVDEEFYINDSAGYEQMESVERGSSDKEVVVTYDGIYTWWMPMFGHILHPAVATAEDFNTGYLNKMHNEWGAGPFVVDESSLDFDKGVVTFVPNEKWWGKPTKLDSITYRVLEDQAEINAFKNGEIDATGVGNKDRLAQVKDMQGIKVYTGVYPATILFVLNSKSDHLSDPLVREAVMTAFDRASYAKVRYQGLNYEEPLPGSLMLYGFQEDYQDNFGKVVTFDTKHAGELLEKAGYTKGEDGYYAKDGQRLTLRYPLLGDSEMAKALATALQSMMKAAGMEVVLESRPSSDFSKVYTTRDFDLFDLRFTSTDPYGVGGFGQDYASNSNLNLSGTGTEEFDAKIKELQKISDPEEQTKKANELEVEAFKQFGVLPVLNGPSMVAVKEGLANFGPHGFEIIPAEMIGWKA